MSATVTVANPYWDAVAPLLTNDRWRGRQLGGFDPDIGYTAAITRTPAVKQWAWTVSHPDTVKWVVDQIGGRAVLDPMAGSGYWPWLLRQHGIDAAAYDLHPEGSNWHNTFGEFGPVRAGLAQDVATIYPDRVLWLSWPPYDTDAGFATLNAYAGDTVVYIGEGEGGCCGSDDMHRAFEQDWDEVATHRPVQWFGLHDWVTVYRRKP